MDKSTDHTVATGVRRLYQSDDNVKAFFDWVGTRQNDSRATTVDRILTIGDIGRAEAINLCKKLQKLGCGKFVVGRRGSKSRIEWDYSLLSLGKTATGISEKVVEIETEDIALQDAGPEIKEREQLSEPFPIQMAKQKLAETLGISADAIEITIKV
jgi:hypothetical protein